MINNNKLHQLQENYNAEPSNKAISFKSFVEHNAENDRNFFRWLFDAELEKDFDASISDEQKK